MTDSTSVPALQPQFFWPNLVPATPEQAFRAAVGNPTLPKFYANTFTNVVGPTEVAVLFGAHGSPNTIVSISYAVAKSLSAKLAQAVKDYEEKTGTVVVDAEALEKLFQPTP